METNRSLPMILAAFALFAVSCQGKATSPSSPAPMGEAATEAASPAASAKVAYLEGTVTQDGKALSIGDAIFDGALLQTDADGLAEIVFDEKNAIRISPSASLRVQFSTLQKSMNIERGTVTAVLRKLDKLSGGKMDITTPSLVAGVRGTSFCVWVMGAREETYFCTCNGRIEFTPGGTEKSIIEEANHHEALVFSGTGAGVTTSPATAEMNARHGDADLESLAARIGEKMDWTHVEN